MARKSSDVDTAAPTKKVVASSKFGKDILICRRPNGQGFEIEMSGGGTKPSELEGYFTRVAFAEHAIENYVQSGKAKRVEPEPKIPERDKAAAKKAKAEESIPTGKTDEEFPESNLE